MSNVHPYLKRENPRYEIVGNPERNDDWHPNDWIGKSSVANKRDYIALPPKIELCLAFQLDSRHYHPEQNAQFYKASTKFNDFYMRRRKRGFYRTFQKSSYRTCRVKLKLRT